VILADIIAGVLAALHVLTAAVARAARIHLALMGPAAPDFAAMEHVSQGTAVIKHAVVGGVHTKIAQAVSVSTRPAAVATVRTAAAREAVAPTRPVLVAIARTDIVRATAARTEPAVAAVVLTLPPGQGQGHTTLITVESVVGRSAR